MYQDTLTVESVLNLTEAMNNLDGDAELLQEIAEIFIEAAPEQLQSIANLIATGDVSAVSIEAHSMKGAASNICAEQFVASAFELEQLTRNGTLAGASELLEQMREHFGEIREVAEVINWNEVASSWRCS